MRYISQKQAKKSLPESLTGYTDSVNKVPISSINIRVHRPKNVVKKT